MYTGCVYAIVEATNKNPKKLKKKHKKDTIEKRHRINALIAFISEQPSVGSVGWHCHESLPIRLCNNVSSLRGHENLRLVRFLVAPQNRWKKG